MGKSGDGRTLDSVEAVNRAIDHIKDCSGQQEVASNISSLIAYFDLSSYVFLVIQRGSTRRHRKWFLIGCSPEWCQIYNDRKWFMIDPFVDHALRDSRPILGSAIVPKSPGQIELMAIAAEYGFRSGIVIPAHTGLGSRVGVLYLGSNKSAAEMESRLLASRHLLRVIAMELFEWWEAKYISEAIGGHRFDEIEVELLRLYHEGFNTAAAAAALGLTFSQVNNRFRSINQTLGTRNRKEAVELAFDLGILRESL
jgi:hypothetical protein